MIQTTPLHQLLTVNTNVRKRATLLLVIKMYAGMYLEGRRNKSVGRGNSLFIKNNARVCPCYHDGIICAQKTECKRVI